MRPGGTAYVADHTDDEFPHTAVYCSPRCRHFAERPDTTYLRDDGAALAAARARTGDGDIHDLDEAYEVQGHVTALAQELPRLRERIDALRAKADDVHADLAKVYRTDAADLAAIADACDAGHYIAAARHVDDLDTAVRDELGQRLYDAIRALAADQEPAGIDEQDLFDALKDNLSPQAVRRWRPSSRTCSRHAPATPKSTASCVGWRTGSPTSSAGRTRWTGSRMNWACNANHCLDGGKPDAMLEM